MADFSCQIIRRHNEARPDGSPQCEHMELTVVAPGRMDLNLYEWYIGQSCLSGRILIELPAPSPNQPAAWKEVLFEDGLCYSIAEEYHIDESVRRTLKLQVVSREVTIDDIVFKSRI